MPCKVQLQEESKQNLIKMAKKWNEGKSFLLVTGASRGLGQAFSISLGSNLGQGSTIYLTARSEQALIQTRDEILSKNSNVEVKYFIIDHGSAEKESYVNMLNKIKSEDFDSSIIVHNAGTVGKQGQMVREYDDTSELQNYYNLNLFSVAILNSIFMKTFSQGKNISKVFFV